MSDTDGSDSITDDRDCIAYAELYFDGSASENPGPAAWGAYIMMHIIETGHCETIECSAPIGYATSNVAEYLGLISSLRKLLNLLQRQSIRHSSVDVQVFGDSQLVINQINGTNRVRAPDLLPLYTIVKHLIARFRKVKLNHCSREDNRIADRNARNACRLRILDENKAIYYPALTNYADAWIGKTHTLASHDCLTAGSDPSLFIDSSFLYSLPGGEQMLGNIRDPHPLSVVVGKVDMAVLGYITANIGVSFSRRRRSQPNGGPQKNALVDIVVVHKLPVPMHISVRNPDIGMPDVIVFGGGIKFNKDNIPARYSDHPYWDEGGINFIGIDVGY